uniref:Uncharacterized protein n=1 Tax=Oryza brachyantha TaxID=4533 RepID=J3N1Y0_ORYBR
MAIKDRFSGNPEGLTRTNHKPEWATDISHQPNAGTGPSWIDPKKAR